MAIEENIKMITSMSEVKPTLCYDNKKLQEVIDVIGNVQSSSCEINKRLLEKIKTIVSKVNFSLQGAALKENIITEINNAQSLLCCPFQGIIEEFEKGLTVDQKNKFKEIIDKFNENCSKGCLSYCCIKKDLNKLNEDLSGINCIFKMRKRKIVKQQLDDVIRKIDELAKKQSDSWDLILSYLKHQIELLEQVNKVILDEYVRDKEHVRKMELKNREYNYNYCMKQQENEYNKSLKEQCCESSKSDESQVKKNDVKVFFKENDTPVVIVGSSVE